VNAYWGGIGLGVWGRKSNDVWAVGQNGTILHWDGTSWKSVVSGTIYDLDGIWGSATNDAWAVGTGETILHYSPQFSPATTP
jgi:hypothetical protein